MKDFAIIVLAASAILLSLTAILAVSATTSYVVYSAIEDGSIILPVASSTTTSTSTTSSSTSTTTTLQTTTSTTTTTIKTTTTTMGTTTTTIAVVLGFYSTSDLFEICEGRVSFKIEFFNNGSIMEFPELWAVNSKGHSLKLSLYGFSGDGQDEMSIAIAPANQKSILIHTAGASFNTHDYIIIYAKSRGVTASKKISVHKTGENCVYKTESGHDGGCGAFALSSY